MSIAVSSLRATAPTWARIVRCGSGYLQVECCIERAGGIPSRIYNLLIREVGNKVSVKECPNPKNLPQFCPDRHINSDGTFCIGFRAQEIVTNQTAAERWWSLLSSFIACQETAHSRRTWPDYAWLSHGEEAAELHLQAENLAADLGLSDLYREDLQGNTNAISKFCRKVNPKTMRLVNGRSSCVCGREDRRGRPLARRDCCRQELACLPVLEKRRRDAVKEFWKQVADQTCCETMNDCPLSKTASKQVR